MLIYLVINHLQHDNLTKEVEWSAINYLVLNVNLIVYLSFASWKFNERGRRKLFYSDKTGMLGYGDVFNWK